MPSIKNKLYKEFLQKGLIRLLTKQEFEKLLEATETSRPRGCSVEQAKSLLILLYYTGRRPIEILSLTRDNFEKQYTWLRVIFPTAKQGVASLIPLPLKNPHIKLLWDYVRSLPPMFYAFWAFRPRKVTQKKIRGRTYQEITAKLRYWIRKWSKEALGMELVPYFFRHHRLSELAMKGASPVELKFWKGARSLKSVEPYLHLSEPQMKKLAKLLG